MADLGQLMGTLLASVAHARRIADEETTAIAEYYRSNPLLSGMSIPRIRIPELSLNLPVLITGYAEGEAPKLRDTVAIVSAIEGALEQRLTILQPQQRNKLIEAFRKNLQAELRALRRPSDAQQSENREHVARAVDRAFLQAAKTVTTETRLSRPELTAIARDLQQTAREVAYEELGVPPRIDASIITADIKDQASSGTVMRLRLVVREEGLEWDTIEQSDGTTRSALSPE